MHKPLLTMSLSVVLSGCMLGPDYVRPDMDIPSQFAHRQSADLVDGSLLATYWDMFKDDTLKTLIDETLAANHDLRIATVRLGETRASRHAALADLFPLVTSVLKRDRSARSPEESPGIPDDQLRSDYYDFGFDASWEVSLFGRGARGVQAQNAFRDAAIANVWGTQVAVTAEVARNYFELRGMQARRDILLANAKSQEESLTIVSAQFDAGRANELDRLRAQAQHASTLALVPQLDTAITRSIYRLSVLSGRTPQALQSRLEQPAAMPELPALEPVGAPANLLRRRPDILMAERDLAGRTALIGHRLAELFPRVFFIGGVGTASTSFDHLGDSNTTRWQFSPQLQWAAFDLPRVLATVKVERAKTKAALLRYEQVVLQALEDAEGSLRAYERSAVTESHLRNAAKASNEAANLARLRYENGLSDFLSVLDADRAKLAADDQLIQAHITSATGLIAVFKALGGGWQGPASP